MITWAVDPVAIDFGFLQIRWYGILFLSGFYIGFFYMQKVCRFENLPVAKLDSLLIYMIAGTTIGARLGHCLFYEWDYYSEHLSEIPMIWKGGLASHGGALGVILSLYIFSKRNPEFKFTWLLDRCSIVTVFTGILIRLANLMNSEIIGKPTDGTWGFIFKRLDMIPRHPAQLYESFCYLLIWLGSLFWYQKYYKKNPPTGLIFGWVIGTIFIARIIIEHWKENQEAFEANMTLNMGQILSIPFILLGVFLFVRGFLKGPNSLQNHQTSNRRKNR